ncbi:MAG: hypothetical protein ACFFE4_00080 [Candidatus Thorarchaeota archaeon]
MEKFIDLAEDIDQKINDIQMKVLSGKIVLLDLELVPIFENIKNGLTINNLDKYSTTFKKSFDLLIQKFEELKRLINNLDKKENFIQYLKSNPSDSEVYELFNDCSVKPFTIQSLSSNFLNISSKKLSRERGYPVRIDQIDIDRTKIKESFLLEVPEQKFTEKLMDFFNAIKNKLPCSFDEIFEDDHDQIEIYEKFVYLLHLLQLGNIKYQKDTNFLYV